MHTKVFNSITEIEENKWNSIVGRNSIICSYAFLLAVEKSNINDCKYFYPVIYEYDKIVAHACVYSMTTELDTLTSGLIKKIIIFIRKFWKNFLKIKFIECGTPIALGNVISFVEYSNKQLALYYLISEIENISRKEKTKTILIRDFYEKDIIFFDKLKQMGYKRVNNLPNTSLEVKWSSFDEYLSNLRRNYRYTIIKRIRHARMMGLTVEIMEDFSSISENLRLLWHNVYNNAKEYRREILTEDFFKNISNYLGNRSKVILYKYNNHIIAFGLVLMDDDLLRCMYLGMDYNFSKKFAMYNNSFYYSINLAITEGKKDIDLGMTSYLSKIEVGAEMFDSYMYLKHLNKLLNPLITGLFTLLTPKIKIIKKNIFKEKIENKFEKEYSAIHN